jgi:hypothetical protein
VELNSLCLLIGFIIFFVASFFMIPITFVQSLANFDALDKNFSVAALRQCKTSLVWILAARLSQIDMPQPESKAPSKTWQYPHRNI